MATLPEMQVCQISMSGSDSGVCLRSVARCANASQTLEALMNLNEKGTPVCSPSPLWKIWGSLNSVNAGDLSPVWAAVASSAIRYTSEFTSYLFKTHVEHVPSADRWIQPPVDYLKITLMALAAGKLAQVAGASALGTATATSVVQVQTASAMPEMEHAMLTVTAESSNDVHLSPTSFSSAGGGGGGTSICFKILCSFAGRIMPRPSNGALKYIGGTSASRFEEERGGDVQDGVGGD